MQVFVVGTTLAGSLATAYLVQRALLGMLLEAMNAQRVPSASSRHEENTEATGAIR
jgi:hypothetical protein